MSRWFTPVYGDDESSVFHYLYTGPDRCTENARSRFAFVSENKFH